MRAGRGSCLAASLPDSLTSPPRACRVLIIPRVAGFYFETKRGLLMGIQLKPAANICFDAAAAAGQAGGGGSRRRGPRCARVNHAAGMLGVAGRWDRRPPARGPLRNLAAPGPACREGCPGASRGRTDPAVRGRWLQGPLIPARGAVGEPAAGARGHGSGAGRDRPSWEPGVPSRGQPGQAGTHSVIPHIFIWHLLRTRHCLEAGDRAMSQMDSLSQPRPTSFQSKG